MKVKFSTTNSKLGLIPSVNLPPILTCRENCPCAKDCYALRGRFRFPNVRDAMKQNYLVYKENPTEYFKEIKDFLSAGIVTYAYFRWHAAGDIVDSQYFEGMVKTAIECPHTHFLAFTKKFELVNKYIRANNSIPSSLKIVFSAWGDSFQIENPYSLPVAYVRFPCGKNELIPKEAMGCSGDCTHCLQCWNLEKGQSVVFNKH